MDNQTDQEQSAHNALFKSEEVIAVTGINQVTLQNWLARGRLKLAQQNPGRGKPRQYTMYEVARVRFLKKFVDLGFPVAPAFKITAALKRLWEDCPGGHELYGREPKLASWLLVAEAEVWNRQRRVAPFPLSHSSGQTDRYVAVWATEIIGSHNGKTIRDAINFFADGGVIVVNMGVLLDETVSRLRQCLAERDG